MPDRVIRDELLRSHRYRRLSSDTVRLLFMHILLSVDSIGNMEANATAIGDAVGRPIDDETVARWLAELSDSDLIRLYDVAGKRYLHIPRFRQRLRYLRGKYPRPPDGVECNEIRQLITKVGLQSDSSHVTVARSRSRSTTTTAPEPVDNSAKSAKPVDNFGTTHAGASTQKRKAADGGQWWKSDAGIASKAAALGVSVSPGKSFADLKDKCFAMIRERGDE